MKTMFFSVLVAVFLASSNFLQAQTDKAVAVVQAYFTGVDAGAPDNMVTLFAADFMASAPFLAQPVPLDAWREVGRGLKAGFPDMQHEIVDWVSDGHKVAVRGIFRGTNTGMLRGNPPTGNKVSLPFNTAFDLDKDLKIKAIYVQFDQVAMQQQLMAGIDLNAPAEAMIRTYMAALDAVDMERIAALCAPGVKQYFAGEMAPFGLSDVQKRAQAFRTGFPEVKREIQQIVVAGNWVTVRGIFTGTNTGVFLGKPATGKSVRIPHLALFRLNAQGLIEEAYVEFDTKQVEKQLGDQTAGGK